MLKKATNNLKEIKSIAVLIKSAADKGVLNRSVQDIRANIDHFYVYLVDDKIVGCCSLEIYSPKLAEIRSLVVMTKYQKRGIGSKLVQACINEAKRKSIYQILTITKRLTFFSRFGFSNSIGQKQSLINLL